MRALPCFACGVILLAASASEGQYGNANFHWGYNTPYGGWGWGYSGPIGTTPAESYARGMADLTRARGEAYQAAARGAIDYEAARQTYIQNQKLWQQTMDERRRMGLAERNAYYEQKRASRDRYLQNRSRATTETLSASQYDPETGRISWPAGVADSAFEEDRQAVEQLLQMRAHTSANSMNAADIAQHCQNMLATMKSLITTIPAPDYIEARKFLEGLMAETQQGPA